MKNQPLLSFTVLLSLRHVLFSFLDAISACVYYFIYRPISGSGAMDLVGYSTLNYILTLTHCGQQKTARLGCSCEPAIPGLRNQSQLILLRNRPWCAYLKSWADGGRRPCWKDLEESLLPCLGLFAKINDKYQGKECIQAHWNSASSPNSDDVSDCFVKCS